MLCVYFVAKRMSDNVIRVPTCRHVPKGKARGAAATLVSYVTDVAGGCAAHRNAINLRVTSASHPVRVAASTATIVTSISGTATP
jgi:hypothetical protein